MGSRDFQIHILYYHYLGMTYTSKIILHDGFRSKHIIFKVLDYVIGDFGDLIGARNFNAQIFYNNYIVISYRSKIIPLDD